MSQNLSATIAVIGIDNGKNSWVMITAVPSCCGRSGQASDPRGYRVSVHSDLSKRCRCHGHASKAKRPGVDHEQDEAHSDCR